MSSVATLDERDARDDQTYKQLLKMIDDDADSAAFECVVNQHDGPTLTRVRQRLRCAIFTQGQRPGNWKWWPLERLEELVLIKYPPPSAGGLISSFK